MVVVRNCCPNFLVPVIIYILCVVDFIKNPLAAAAAQQVVRIACSPDRSCIICTIEGLFQHAAGGCRSRIAHTFSKVCSTINDRHQPSCRHARMSRYNQT